VNDYENHGKLWTNEHYADLFRYFTQNISITGIARELGRQSDAVMAKLSRANLARVTTLNQIDMYLDVGIRVHWKGAKFEFDGTVEDFDTYEVRDDDFDAKVVYLRRDDTGTKVSLTLRDLQTGSLTLR
jgi:hypothetical protein